MHPREIKLRMARKRTTPKQFLKPFSKIVSLKVFFNIYFFTGQYERKGNLYKKSLNNHKFKQRQFVLLEEQLFYYKKNIIG